jgi:hypothetical protein
MAENSVFGSVHLWSSVHTSMVFTAYTINPLMRIPTCVPTGIKTGVSTSQCNKLITLDRALHTSHFALIWKLSAALFPRAGIFKTLETVIL